MSGALNARRTSIAVAGVLAVVGAWPAQAVAATPTPTVPNSGTTGPAPATSPGASVAVVTTRSTVHAAGSTVPAWGLVFLIAVFVVAVAVALPATRRRSADARRS